MFVGHACVAFLIAALGARQLGWSRSAALRVAVLAGLFATLPDVDIVYGLVGLVGAGTDAGAGLGLAVESFWATGNQVHRGVTHSLPVAAVAAVGAALAAYPSRLSSVGAGFVFGTLVTLVLLVSGPLAGVIAALFTGGAVALSLGARRFDLPPAGVAGAAAAGLLTHPFGDVFTGEPPAFLYPLDATVLAERVTLAADPTMHLLAAFALELATIWLALAMYFRLTDRRVGTHVDRRAALGVGYAGVALALPAPTLDVSYHFVFSVLAVGAVGVSPPPLDRVRTWRGAVTGLAAVTLAAFAYAIVYLAV